MQKRLIAELLNAEGIDLFGVMPLDECRITKKYLLDKAGIENGCVIMMAVPYVSRDFGIGNISEYAKCRDYHLFFKELYERLLPRLAEAFPGNRFAGFADHSPIDERDTAARCGLGIIGKNCLLITKKYSSFVFLGEIVTDLVLPSDACEISFCEDCGACRKKCPLTLDPSAQCLSAITQKKGELTADEEAFIIKNGTVWGCDICQSVCPHTLTALKEQTIYTRIPFFLEKRLPELSYRLVSEMSDGEFSSRAFSWRGRQTIMRNLKLFERNC